MRCCSVTAELPRRLLTSEVCQLARFSVSTFNRRLRSGKLKIEPVDRGSELLWDRDAVLHALGMANAMPTSGQPESSSWADATEGGYRAARARQASNARKPSRGS